MKLMHGVFKLLNSVF